MAKSRFHLAEWLSELSLALALGIFLSEYLLYRYDHDDQTEEGGE